ncbi:hypothetical protein F4861DRAFT_537489 [Xylaria intraflava]|nr:hypothetical protein F4861DRAFT_537489 [Xylaria intraflava]
MASSADSPRFDKPSDYDSWNQEFIHQARVYSMWEYIQPGETRETWPVKPTPPEEPTDDISGAQRDRAFMRYNATYQRYVQEKKDYTEHRRDYQSLNKWMTDTIARRYREELFESSDTLEVWYDKITEIGVAANATMEAELRTEYAAITKPLTKLPKDMIGWSQKWESIISKSKKKGILDLADSKHLYHGLEQALGQLLDSWIIDTKTYFENDIKANTLDHHKVAARLRAHIAERPEKFGPLPKKIKGAFPTYNAHEEDDGDADIPETGLTVTRGRRNKKKSSNNPSRANSETPASGATSRATSTVGKRPRAGSKVCRLCEAHHALEECWYAFPDKAPEDWIPKAFMQKAVQLLIQADASLANEIARIKGKKATKESKESTPRLSTE